MREEALFTTCKIPTSVCAFTHIAIVVDQTGVEKVDEWTAVKQPSFVSLDLTPDILTKLLQGGGGGQGEAGVGSGEQNIYKG